MFIDFSRHQDLLDHQLMATTSLTIVGLGGAVGLLCNLTRAGVNTVNLVEFDTVSPTNPATQGYDAADIGLSKCQAAAAKARSINPDLKCEVINKRLQDLTPSEQDRIWAVDAFLAMTDDFDTESLINRQAIQWKRDAFFAICYIGCEAVEVTATFPDELERGVGCHRCHTKARYDAYADGFDNPQVIASHILAAEYLNALIGLLVVSRLHHRAGSPLAISRIAAEFAERPCLISRIGPDFYSQPGEPFADLAPSRRLFASEAYALDTPKGWVCPDCGTPGVIARMAAR